MTPRRSQTQVILRSRAVHFMLKKTKNASKYLLTLISFLVVPGQTKGCLQEDLFGEKFQLISTGMFLRSPETLVRFFIPTTRAHLAPFQLIMYYKESLEAKEILTLLVFSSSSLSYSSKLGKPTKPWCMAIGETQTKGEFAQRSRLSLQWDLL